MAAADDSLGLCGLVQGLCGLVQVFLVPRSAGVLAKKDGRTGSPRDLEIRSDASVARELRLDGREEEDLPPAAPVEDFPPVSWELRFADQEENLSPAARNSPVQRNGMAGGVVDDDDDDDDCVILDSDPHSTVTVKGGKEGGAGDGGSDEELQIVAEKGQVACRDFPHSRHLCSNMPFDTTSHEKHCSMCYCFVCDAPAPCSYWDKGISVYKHCHATDKETIWKTLRQAFRLGSNGSGTSNGHTAQISHPLPLTVSAPRAHPAAGAGRGTSNSHTAQISHPLALNVSATRVQSGIGNGHSTQVTHLVEPRVSAPRVAPGAGRGTSNGHSAQVPHTLGLTASAPRAHPATGAGRRTSNTQASHSLALTVSGPRASSATRVQSGTHNGHSAQVTHLVEPTVSAPRPHPAAGAGRGTSNAHTALITHPVEPTVSGARPYSAARSGTVTSNVHNSQITHPVDPTVSGRRAYPAGSTGRGISNAHTAQITRPVEQTISAPRVYPGARAGRGSINARSAQNTYSATTNGEPDAPEGATVYIGNLPYHIDNERLKLSFQDAGVVLFSKVICDRETGQSRGFGYVTMNTVQEAEAAVRMYQGSMVYGRPLTVKIAPPRGGSRVDTARRQSDSPLKIFVCNLPTQVDHSRLEQLFSKHGKVVDARVIYESRGDTCCSRGFGFVTMASEEESHKAIHALNKQVLEGHALRVKVARDMRPQRGGLSLSNQNPLDNAVSGSQNAHTSVRGSPSVAPSVSAAGAGSSTSNADAAHSLT